MTIIVGLYAGPGTGKSTVAAGTFFGLKCEQVNTELVKEFAKDLVWGGRQLVTLDQFFIFGSQADREHSLCGAVDVIVTDAPVLIPCYYAHVYGDVTTSNLFRSMAIEYRRMMMASGHRFLDVWLNRVKPYETHGRVQTETEATDIDVDMGNYLRSLRVECTSIDADEKAPAKVCELVRQQM